MLIPAVIALAAAHLSVTTATASADLPDIPYERYLLDNGLEVILHEDHRVPLVAVDAWYHVGSGDETPGKSGFAHLFEHMMFQGAKHIGMDVHFDVLREAGASSINGTTNTDRTNYFEVVPKNQLETALWLESDRMGFLLEVLDEKQLDNQREVVRNERRQRYDNAPYGKERFVIAESLYPEGHPYRYLTIGRHEDLASASVDDVKGFFQKWYAPANATLLIAGDFDKAQVKQLVAKWFGTFPKVEKPIPRAPAPPVLAASVRKTVEDPFARLSRVHYVWRTPANLQPGDLELSILADVLGAPGWGRLYKRLVLQEQVATTVSAYQDGMNYSGEFHVVVTLRPGTDAAKVEQMVREEMMKALYAPPSIDEVRRSQISTEASLVFSLEELLSRAERLQYFNHFTGDPGYTARYIKDLRQKSPADVQRAARMWLAKPRIEILTVPAPAQAAVVGGAK
jgi:zinc protease